MVLLSWEEEWVCGWIVSDAVEHVTLPPTPVITLKSLFGRLKCWYIPSLDDSPVCRVNLVHKSAVPNVGIQIAIRKLKLVQSVDILTSAWVIHADRTLHSKRVAIHQINVARAIRNVQLIETICIYIRLICGDTPPLAYLTVESVSRYEIHCFSIKDVHLALFPGENNKLVRASRAQAFAKISRAKPVGVVWDQNNVGLLILKLSDLLRMLTTQINILKKFHRGHILRHQSLDVTVLVQACWLIEKALVNIKVQPLQKVILRAKIHISDRKVFTPCFGILIVAVEIYICGDE